MAFHYSPKIVTDGLVLALDAGNPKSYPGSGTTWYDLSGNGLNATLTNGPTFDSGNKGAIQFDGVNDYAVVASSPLTAISVLTFELWINRTGIATHTAPYDRIFQKGGGYSGYPAWGYHIGESTPASPAFKSAHGSGNGDYNADVWFTSGAQIDYDEWHCFATTIDSSNLATNYHNGEFNNSGSLGQSVMDTEDQILIAIGDGREFHGKFSSVKVYNRALSAVEIKQNFEAHKTRLGL